MIWCALFIAVCLLTLLVINAIRAIIGWIDSRRFARSLEKEFVMHIVGSVLASRERRIRHGRSKGPKE